MPVEHDTPLELAIDRLGGLNRAAREMRIGTSAITNWRLRGRVPVARALWLEQATGVSARDLAPWFFNRLDDRESA